MSPWCAIVKISLMQGNAFLSSRSHRVSCVVPCASRGRSRADERANEEREQEERGRQKTKPEGFTVGPNNKQNKGNETRDGFAM